jgi:RNA-directed DNA polymerase
MGALAQAILAGRYRPQPARRVAIPKPGSTEPRVLKIPALGDRVVGKAVHRAWGPLWEEEFLPCSYGFRPGRGPWTLLADLQVRMRALGRSVLVVADIRRAFDNVPVEEVLALHAEALRRLQQPKFDTRNKARTLALVAKVLRGHHANRIRGIDQGGPYSPTALNVLLHYKLDAPLQEHIGSKPLWLRYADNLVYLGQDVPDGLGLLNEVTRLLQPLGLNLKEEAEVVDLCTGGTAHLLGLTVRQEGGKVRYGITPAAWDHLRQQLSQAHAEVYPPAAARDAVLGWLDYLGPAVEKGGVAQVLHTAAQYGFREINPEDVRARAAASGRRWKACLKDARRRFRAGRT